VTQARGQLPRTSEARAAARRGSVVVVLALILVVLMGFAALVIDLGYARFIKGQLQSAADAAAMAGAQVLDGTNAGMSEARTTAVAVAALNNAHGTAVTLDPNTGNGSGGGVVLGIWDGDSFTASTDATKVNAVRVNLADEGVETFFSSAIWSKGPMEASVISTAQAQDAVGAGGVDWYWPFGMPDCLFETKSDSAIQSMTLVLNPDGADNTGWMAIGDTINASWAKNHLANAADCMADYFSGAEVSEDCEGADVSDWADTSNGTIDAGLGELDTLMEASGRSWDSSVYGTMPKQDTNSSIAKAKYGRVLEGPFPILDASDEYCTSKGGKWGKNFQVTGFVWGVMYDVMTKGSNKGIKIKLDLSHVYDVGSSVGGSTHGVVTNVPPTLME